MTKKTEASARRPQKTKQRASTNIDLYIGQRLKARRLECHVSQEELGQQLGVSFQQVQKYEKGVNRIASTRLKHIADILKVPMMYFMGDGKDNRMEPSELTTFLASKDGIRLMEAGMKLSEFHRSAVIGLARSLAELD